MERLDGRDPFNPDTYNKPAASITAMLELRAFCADFFQKHMRTSVKTKEEDSVSFLALIMHSPSFFARARAVIPELQAPEVDSFHPNQNVQLFLLATQGVRGPPGKKWEFLPEEPAWTKLAKDGMENMVKMSAKDMTEHKKQPSNANSHSAPVTPTRLVPGDAESLLHLLTSGKSKPTSLPKKLDLSAIPTFVPQINMGAEELVWSPTSGTRPRRPDEVYQQNTKDRPADTTQFGQATSPNVLSSYNLKNQYLFHGSRDFSDTLTGSQRHSDSIRMTPPPQFESTQSPLKPSAAQSSRSKEIPTPRHMRRNFPQGTPVRDSADRMVEMATLSHDPHTRHSQSSSFGTTIYPVEDSSRTNSPSQFQGPRFPSNQSRGVYGAQPFSAPPSVPSYGTRNQSGQGMYPVSPTPFQGQLGHFESRPVATDPHAFAGQGLYAPNPEIWTTDSPQRARGYPPNQIPYQIPNQIIQPPPRMAPNAQIPPLTTLTPNIDTLSVPPPGSMDPLEYWNMLYQRETDIRTRLQHANRPITPHEHQYITALADARVDAAATQIPARGGLSKGRWSAELHRTLRGVWKTGPGGAGFSPVVVARKMDFEKALEREIEWVGGERG